MEDIRTAIMEPSDLDSGLLNVEQSHQISLHEVDDVNIGIIDGKKQALGPPRADLKRLAPSKELERAWLLLQDPTLSNDQFIDKLTKHHLGGLEKSIVMSAWQSYLMEFPSQNIDLMDALALKQFVYQPFSFLLKAAAGSRNESYYKADKYICSFQDMPYIQEQHDIPQDTWVFLKTDGAVVLYEGGWYPFGMMEIKAGPPSHDLHHLWSYDKCALLTSITALLVKQVEKRENKYCRLAIPFLVAAGKTCSLYATVLDRNGNPCLREVEYPGGRTASNQVLESSSSMERKEIFTAFAILLSEFKTIFYSISPCDEKLAKIRAAVRSGLRGLNRSCKRRTPEAHAQEAAACGGKFVSVAYPRVGTLFNKHSSDDILEQRRSPYFFVGYQAAWPLSPMTTNRVFLKVWKVAEANIDCVEKEWMNYQCAYDAGVPVAAPATSEVTWSTSSRGSSYLVMAVDYIRQDAIETMEDIVSFSRSLIETVDKLHQQAQLLHGDLKPDNVRWSNGVVLSD